MEQETTHQHQIPTEKIYRDKEVWVGTFIGGPLVAGYLIAKNFKTFGETQKALTTWVIAILVTAGLFWMTMFAPYIERLPNFILPLLYTGIAYVLMRLYQGEKIRAHISAGGRTHGWWKTVSVTLIGLLMTMIPFVGTGVLLDCIENTNRAVKSYGTTQHEINYDRRNLTESEVDVLAEAFRKTNFFDDSGKWYIYAKKVDDSYEISISVTKAFINEPQILESLGELRTDMQTFFPNNKIIFNLVVGDFDKVLKRLE